MQIQYITKNINLVYLWIFIPSKFLIKEEVLHEIEHKLFFFPELKNIMKGNVLISKNTDVNYTATTFHTGIRLEVTTTTKFLNKVIKIIKEISEKPLINWPDYEKKRFNIEKKEMKDSSSFLELGKQYKNNIFKNNDIYAENLSAKKAWDNNMDFQNIRTLIVGPVAIKESFPWKVIPIIKKECLFPQEKKYIDWYKSKKNYTYNIFFGVSSTPFFYACLILIIVILKNDLTSQFSLQGKSYDSDFDIWHEQDFIFAGLDIDTYAIKKVELKLSNSITPQYFTHILQHCITDQKIDNDLLWYKNYPVIGFLPSDLETELKNMTYKKFIQFYTIKIKELSIYWC